MTTDNRTGPRLTARHQSIVKDLLALADRHQWRAQVVWTRQPDQPTDPVEVQLGPYQPEPLEHATVTWSHRRSGCVRVRPGWWLDLELADAYIAAYRERRHRSRYSLGYDGLEAVFYTVTGNLP